MISQSTVVLGLPSHRGGLPRGLPRSVECGMGLPVACHVLVSVSGHDEAHPKENDENTMKGDIRYVWAETVLLVAQ